MADTVVHIGENSPEQIAYRLTQDILTMERKALHTGDLSPGWSTAGRQYLLDTYAECLRAVRGLRKKPD
jgi:hypothetical protein